MAEVARMFGIPPHMLMSTEKTTSWGSGIEQMSIGYVVYTLRFILTRIEQRLSRVLRPQAVYARFSVEGLLRGDSAQRSAFYRTMWELGGAGNETRDGEVGRVGIGWDGHADRGGDDGGVGAGDEDGGVSRGGVGDGDGDGRGCGLKCDSQ